jgi:predicted TIM-barrel fold metal-dependent hydrolase
MAPAKPSVDCHAHVFSADAPAIAGARYRPAYEATLGAWRAQWARAGVTHGVLVQPSFFGTDNREMLAAIAQAPDRLRGVAVVDEDVTDEEIGRLHAGGVRAIRLNLLGAADYTTFAGDAWRGLFERIASLGWHLETLIEAGRAPELAGALAHSRVDVVFDHFANPAIEPKPTFAALRALSRNRNVWIKLSAPYRTVHADPRGIARQAAESVGIGRIVWGSDWPWTRHEAGRDYAVSLRALEDWVGAERIGRVLWDNAAALYAFD